MNYENLLLQYVSKDKFRTVLNTDLSVGNFTVASDAHRICFFDQSYKKSAIDAPDQYSEPILKIINHGREIQGVIPVAKLLDIKVYEKTVVEECEACEGDGSVEFEFEFDGETYYESCECPICAGEGGRDTNETEPDLNKQIGFGNTRISPNYLKYLGENAKEFGFDEVVYFKQESPHSVNIFQFGPVTIAIMPQMQNEETYVGEFEL